MVLNAMTNIPIVFFGYTEGLRLKTGGIFQRICSKDNPARRAYEYVLSDAVIPGTTPETGREFWDDMAEVWLLAGTNYYTLSSYGRNIIDSGGNNVFTNDSNSRHRYVTLITNRLADLAVKIESLHGTPPAAGTGGNIPFELRVGTNSVITEVPTASTGGGKQAQTLISSGCYWNGTTWIATATNAAVLRLWNDGVDIFRSTGLTIGSGFSPATFITINGAGDVSGFRTITASGDITAYGHSLLAKDVGATNAIYIDGKIAPSLYYRDIRSGASNLVAISVTIITNMAALGDSYGDFVLRTLLGTNIDFVNSSGVIKAKFNTTTGVFNSTGGSTSNDIPFALVTDLPSGGSNYVFSTNFTVVVGGNTNTIYLNPTNSPTISAGDSVVITNQNTNLVFSVSQALINWARLSTNGYLNITNYPTAGVTNGIIPTGGDWKWITINGGGGSGVTYTNTTDLPGVGIPESALTQPRWRPLHNSPPPATALYPLLVQAW